MSKLITANINLSKIDKERLFTTKKGEKMLNVTIWINDEPDDYGNNVSIQQSQTKEERERGDKKLYLGNGKTWGERQ